MTRTLIKGAGVVTPAGLVKDSAVLLEGSSISMVGEGGGADETIDLGGEAVLLPGFVDIHNHGAVGVDVNEADADGLREVGRFLATKGVTAWVPTFVPDSVETYSRVIAAMSEVAADVESAGARIVGVHYEGIFANTRMCGALRPQFFRTFSGSELDDIPSLEGGAHMTTFAPEVEGGVGLVEALIARRWVPSIGHTCADVATLDAVFAAGAHHVTHLFNAMTGLHHRDLGVAGWALAKEGVTCDIIADGIHVRPEVLEMAYRLKTSEGLVLISDSVAPTGLGDGDYELWGEKLSVTGGKTRNERGSIAGSVVTMLDAVRLYLGLGASFEDVARMASGNAAKLLGLDGSIGSISPGMRADLVALDGDGRLLMTLVGGQVNFRV